MENVIFGQYTTQIDLSYPETPPSPVIFFMRVGLYVEFLLGKKLEPSPCKPLIDSQFLPRFLNAFSGST